MICVHHNKDLDGFTSGAVVRRKFPDCKLIGWDYGLAIPKIPDGQDVILIDISFPMQDMLLLRRRSKSLTWIDHHISAKKDFDEYFDGIPFEKHGITYVYELGKAACEIGWKYFFPNEKMPESVLLLGEYDTWRNQDEKRWKNEIMPFQFFMRGICTSPKTFPDLWFIDNMDDMAEAINIGASIINYQEQQDMLKCERGAFEKEVYGGLRGLCLNEAIFSSDTMKSIYDKDKDDILVGFTFNKTFWRISLRSLKDDVDVSVIAKARGGGGHKKAAGFEVKTFEEIFK